MVRAIRSLRLPSVAVAVALAGALAAGCAREETERMSAEALGAQVGDVAPEAFETAATNLSGELLVHVPCGMIIPVKKAITVFKQANPGIQVTEDYDNASVLVSKIVDRGVRPDVFISPGSSEVGRLEEEGLVDPDAKVCLGSFELVIITNRDSDLEISSPADLRLCRTISIPEPGVNSVGTSGQEALTNLGLWDELEPKMVMTDQAIKSHNYVVQGKADAGISYLACPLETNPDKMDKSQVRVACEFPPDSYERQKVWAAPLKTSRNPEAAQALIRFLASPQGLKILADNGLPGTEELVDGSSQEISTASSASAIMGETGIGSVGPPDAPIQIVAYFPNNDTHAETWNFIYSLSERYGDKVHLEMVDFESDAGFDRWLADGFDCGAIAINGKTHWVFERDGKPAEATFRKKMGQDWFQEDLIAVLDELASGDGA